MLTLPEASCSPLAPHYRLLLPSKLHEVRVQEGAARAGLPHVLLQPCPAAPGTLSAVHKEKRALALGMRVLRGTLL